MKKIILSSLLLGISLPVLATECPPDKPLESEDSCYSCDSLEGLDMRWKEEKQDICPNREIVTVMHYGSLSYPYEISILKKCPPEAPLRSVEGCIPCDNKQHQVVAISDCSVCPNLSVRSLGKDHVSCLPPCPENKFLAEGGVSWKCISCTDGYVTGITESDCQKCPNRFWNEEKQSCLFKESPCGKNIAFVKNRLDEGWECISCENGYYIRGFSKEECEKCPDYRFWNEEKNVCDFKRSPYPEKPIMIPIKYLSLEGYSFESCDDESYNIPKEECSSQDRTYGYVAECKKTLCLPNFYYTIITA